MKFDGVGASTALFRDFLALPDRLTLGDQQPVVVTVGGEVGVIVLDDDQLTKTHDAVARVHDLAVGHSHDRIAALPADVDTLVDGRGETACDLARCRPLPG